MARKDMSGYFAQHGPEIESLQTLPPDATFEQTETNYFGFNIPDEQIQMECWLWHRVALGVTTGGHLLWQGMNQEQLQALCLDSRLAMPTPKDITDCTYATGMKVKLIEPLKKVRISYDSPEQETKFDVELTAIMPPAFRGNPKTYADKGSNWGYYGGHYSQAMRTRGSVTVGRRAYEVNGYFTRDRSWGEKRGEKSTNYPDIGWYTGVFDENFAFHIYGFQEFSADWKQRFPGIEVPEGVRWGYVWIDGELRGIDEAKIVAHAGDRFYPKAFDILIIDSEGDRHELKGTVTAAQPVQATPQLWAYYFTTRWEMKNRVGWGNSQYAVWHKYYKCVKPGPGKD